MSALDKALVTYAFPILFALCAYCNYNDPDPVPWMSTYGLSALYFTQALSLGFQPRIIVSTIFFVAVALLVNQIVQTFPIAAVEDTWDFFEYEEGRELVGLSLLLLAFVYTLGADYARPPVASKGAKPPTRSSMKSLVGGSFLALVLVAIAAAFWLQPLMNVKRPVAHCSGAL